jgi:hypothetical protein
MILCIFIFVAHEPHAVHTTGHLAWMGLAFHSHPCFTLCLVFGQVVDLFKEDILTERDINPGLRIA